MALPHGSWQTSLNRQTTMAVDLARKVDQTAKVNKHYAHCAQAPPTPLPAPSSSLALLAIWVLLHS